MIDCPICHVKNNDDARFCAECGQRLAMQPSGASLAEPINAFNQQRPPQPQQQPPQSAPPPTAAPPPAAAPLPAAQQQPPQKHQPIDPQTDPNRPFKNPYDPRNAGGPETQPLPQSQQQEPPRKLRSPLLSGEEFDDSDFAEQDPPPANLRGGGLRSPLLGGGEGGGGGGALRSPMLGGGRQGDYEDYDDEPQTGGGLRSPLLGGGGAGGGGYSGGSDRRKVSDANWGGQERRRGLRSPILGGASGDEYYDDYDEEPIDEDNPNVLRSPLLAAKRPLDSRPRNESSPQGSNMQNPPAPGQVPDISRNLPNPSQSYTSLKSVRNASTSSAPPPQTVPPAPSAQPMIPPQASMPSQPQQPQQPPQQQPPQQQQPPVQSGPPTNVPPSFSSVYNERRPPEPTAPVPTAQPVRPDELTKFNQAAQPQGTVGDINVQPPISGSQHAIVAPDSRTDEPRRAAPRRPGLLNQYTDDDEQDYERPMPSKQFGQSYESPGSPLPKIIGAIAAVLFLVKAWAFFTGFMPTEWSKTGWLLMDQITMMGVYLCVAVLGLTRRE